MKEVIKTAPTVEEAIELALAELGLSRDEVSAEVIEYPEKKFFFKKPAKVRVYATGEDFSVKELFREKKPEPAPKAAPEKSEKRPAPEKKADRTEKPDRPERAEKPEKTEKPERTDRPEKAVKRPAPRRERPREEVPEEPATGEKVERALDFLKGIIDGFGVGAYTLRAVKIEGGFVIKVEGENLGCLIGRKGDTMEALSYLTGLAANRGDEYEKVSVDVAGYRKKRERDIERTARRAAIKVRRTGRPFGLEPMNPYERRIVHAAVSGVDGVKSESRGDGASRRVVIYPLNPRPYSDRDRRDRPRYGRGDRRPRSGPGEKSRPQVQKTRDEKLVDSADIGLYSKIELD